MKQMMLPFATFSLYAALELFMTARANRPHEESSRDLKLDVGTSTGELTLTLATGNLGGGKPQPEFQGGDWQDDYGPFEKFLGAMILATGKGCDPKQWGDKYTDYSKGYSGESACKGDNVFLFEKNEYVLPRVAADVFSESDVSKAMKAFDAEFPVLKEKGKEGKPDKTIDPANELYKTETKLADIFADELTKSWRFSGPEACLKQRRSYPYFEEGFMELVQWWGNSKSENSKSEFLTKYLQDLRGTTGDLKALCGKDLKSKLCKKEMVARENEDTTTCKGPKETGGRAKLFTKVGKVDWLSMALFDVYVLQAFVQWSEQQTKAGKALPVLTSMDKTEESAKIKTVAQYFVRNADIFFAQEVGELCLHKEFEETPKTCKKDDKTIDAAMFVRSKETGTLTPDATSTVRNVYDELLDQVIAGKDEEALTYLRYNNADSQTLAKAPKEGEKPNPSVLGKVKLAVADVKGTRLLLVSAHPDSGGIMCAFQLYLVKKVFEEANKKALDLKYLIVGMDVNLMTPEEFIDKKAKAGWKEKDFYPTVDEAEGNNVKDVTPDGMNTGPVNKLGFEVLWPTHATVHKKRTFLQTQLSKAAKHDQVRKDMVFIYPKAGVTKGKVDVWNQLDADKPSFNGEFLFPRLNWPMDHSVSMASVTLA